MSWKEVDWVKSRAPGVPIIVKGILSVDDVILAHKHGVSAVVLSNHGVSNYSPWLEMTDSVLKLLFL